jgi:S1-C subfamily serine protease
MTLKKQYKLLILKLLIISLFGFSVSAEEAGTTSKEPTRRAVIGVNITGGHQVGGPVEGVTIVGVAPGGAADDAGLRVDDVIVEMNGVSLMASSAPEANRALLDFMSGVEPGDELRIIYLRDGQANVATLAAEELDPSMMTEPVYPLMRDLERLGREFGEDVIGSLKFRWRHHGLFAGMELVVVTPELGRYFGTEYGLLVIRAPDDQAIDLQDGDVIREIGGRRPKDPGHAMRILRSYEPGEEVIIGLMRDQRDHDIAVLLPESAPDLP